MKKLVLATVMASFLFMADFASAGFNTLPPTLTPIIDGCCQFENAEGVPACNETTNIGRCRRPIGFPIFIQSFNNQVCNETTGLCELPPRNVPTMSEWGLIAMAGVMGIIGYMILRRRKATA